MIAELRKQLDAHNISAEELCREFLSRAGENLAYITRTPELALENARAAQRMIDQKASTPLTGIPVSVKDNIMVQGIRTTCGSKMLSDYIADYSATAVDRLIRSGAVIVGKTNMDEFAMGADGTTSYFGTCKNPTDTSRVSGGSSGGAAAAVAEGSCVFALGSDTGGSTRQPAAFCGVTGLLPTYGRISRYGLISSASSLDQIGIVANNAEDAGLVLGELSGHDTLDMTSRPLDAEDFTRKIDTSLKGKRIGIIKEFMTGEAIGTAIEFYRCLGCEIVYTSLPSYELIVPAYYIISSAEASSNLGRFDGIRYGYHADADSYDETVLKSRTEGFGNEVKKRIALGIHALSSGGDYYKKASHARQAITNEVMNIFDSCDVIMSPTAIGGAYKICENISQRDKYLGDMYTALANLAGLPSVSTPCGSDENGMPLSLMITGRPYDEAQIISFADKFEKHS